MHARELVRWWIWSIAIWMAFGLVNGTQVVVGMRAEGMHHPWGRLFTVYALAWALWAVVSPLVLALGKRFPPERSWAVHLAAYVAIGIADAVWIVSLEMIFRPMGESAHLVDAVLSFFYSRFHLDLIAYAGVLAVGRTMESRRTLAEREEQLSKARLDALRRRSEEHTSELQ